MPLIFTHYAMFTHNMAITQWPQIAAMSLDLHILYVHRNRFDTAGWASGRAYGL